MPDIIWNFNKFMNQDFKSLSIGLTPSGHIHVGFLSTLACAFMYLREHPKTHLIITSVENSLSTDAAKYNEVPLKFQYLIQGKLVLPADTKQMKKRDLTMHKVIGEVNDVIWKLIHVFDDNTSEERKRIRETFIPPEHKRLLEEKEHKIFHLFGTQIYIYSFLKVLNKDHRFRIHMTKALCDYDFARTIAPITGINIMRKDFGNCITIGKKRYQPKCYKVPVRLYCPDCKKICPDWAVVVNGHPFHPGPHLAARCANEQCKRGSAGLYYDKFVYISLKEGFEHAELHFMLNSMRDFFDPFKADCHIFGGDYFQLEYEHSKLRAIDRVSDMFRYLEKKTNQSKSIFGGPLITMEGRKMSKSGASLKLSQIRKIGLVFRRIVSMLEEARANNYEGGLQIEYKEIIRNAA